MTAGVDGPPGLPVADFRLAAWLLAARGIVVHGLAGAPRGDVFFDPAMVVLPCSRLLQASTIGPFARRLGVAVPAHPE